MDLHNQNETIEDFIDTNEFVLQQQYKKIDYFTPNVGYRLKKSQIEEDTNNNLIEIYISMIFQINGSNYINNNNDRI